MSARPILLLLLAAVLVAGALPAQATGARWDSTVAPPFWVNAGIGAAGSGQDDGMVALSGTLTAVVRPGRAVVARALYMEEFCILGCEGPGPTALTQVGVMYGPVLQRRWWSAAMTAGVSGVFGRRFRYTGDGRSYADSLWDRVGVRTLGVPLEAQLFLRPLPFLGIGGTLHADLNPQATTAGFTASVQLGRLMPGRRGEAAGPRPR